VDAKLPHPWSWPSLSTSSSCAIFPCISGVVSGFDTPLPIFLLTSAMLSVGCRAIFYIMGDLLRARVPRSGQEVKKPLAFVFLRMRVSWPAAILPGVLYTSSTP
jgi:hypothetical protein